MEALTTTAVETTAVAFLEDWRGDAHRDLNDEARRHVGRYIEAIVGRDPVVAGLGEEARQGYAAMLWHSFRTTYDDLRGPFAKSAAEDVARAMRLI